MSSLTDPEENTTYWTFDPLGRVATETINVSSTDLTRTFSYDARGNLVRKVDRNGRVIDYAYDALSRQTTETWYDNLTDADAQQNVRKTYSMEYDSASRVAAVGDGDYDFEYTYSIFGNLTSTTQDLYGLTDDVVFSYAYDVLGRKTSVSAAIGSNDDYVNTYSYDNLGRITQITQDGVSGGNAVAEKRVDFAYSDDGTRATISRFADLAGTKAVAETEQVFDLLGRVTDIVHERAATEFADYDLTWDAAGRISDFDFTSLVGDDGTADYVYDDTNQLTGADYDFQTDETYVYDENGNRTLVNGSTSYTTGDHNRLTSDGTYNYTYDNEGNLLTKTNISTSESVEYTWDHRNRLVKVTFKNSGGTPTKIVEYAYDYGQRWVRKTLDTNADQTIEESRVFVHDNGQIVLDFQKTGTAAASNSDLAHRYLWGNSVDQLLADETVDDGSEDDVAYVLTDHLNSVRDLVVYDPITGTVSVVKHVTFDAFGNVTSDSATGVVTLFRYTARPFDVDAGLQNNLNRWYDLATGRWMSVDPIGYLAGDINLYRYVGNASVWNVDPLGLTELPYLPWPENQWPDWSPPPSRKDQFLNVAKAQFALFQGYPFYSAFRLDQLAARLVGVADRLFYIEFVPSSTAAAMYLRETRTMFFAPDTLDGILAIHELLHAYSHLNNLPGNDVVRRDEYRAYVGSSLYSLNSMRQIIVWDEILLGTHSVWESLRLGYYTNQEASQVVCKAWNDLWDKNYGLPGLINAPYDYEGSSYTGTWRDFENLERDLGIDISCAKVRKYSEKYLKEPRFQKLCITPECFKCPSDLLRPFR